MKIISPAKKPTAEYLPWDDRYPLVFDSFLRRLQPLPPYLVIEHVGSTSIPGCGGKGIIDLLGIYDDCKLDSAKQFLLNIGFTTQGADFKNPWPSDRPMYLGIFPFVAASFVLYIHVVHKSSDEIRRFRAFKARLLNDSNLVREYSEVKRKLIANGITDTDEYAVEKRPIIHRILGDQHRLQVA